MRAIRVHGRGEPSAAATLTHVETPEPGAGQLRVRVGAAAVNLPDVMLCRGTYPLRPDGDFVLGLEAAGVVDAVGPDLEESWIGQRVVGVAELPHGSLAEATIIPADRAYPIPDTVSDRDAAATLIAFQTAHVALHRRAALAAGENLLVLGAAGGVGSAAIQLGNAAGARVIAVVSGAEKGKYCTALGADDVVDATSGDFAAAVRQATAGHGADVVFDPVGGTAYEAAVDAALARDARVLLVGFAGGLQQVDPGKILRSSYSVVGVYVGAYSHDDDGRAYLRDVQDAIFRDLEDGRIRAVIDREVSLDQTIDALEDLAARKVVGKIVVVP
jgi:NADPH:quinone reductase